MRWNKKAVSLACRTLANFIPLLGLYTCPSFWMLPTQLLNRLVGQLRQHKSLPKDRQLWHPREEIYHSATVLEWARREVVRQIGISLRFLRTRNICNWERTSYQIVVQGMVTNRSARSFLADKSVAAVRVHFSPTVTLMWGANLQTMPNPIATPTASLSGRMPHDAMGKTCSQSPLCCDDAARNSAR